MRADVRLSTCFLTTQHAHQVSETSIHRPPVNVALIRPRKGS